MRLVALPHMTMETYWNSENTMACSMTSTMTLATVRALGKEDMAISHMIDMLMRPMEIMKLTLETVFMDGESEK